MTEQADRAVRADDTLVVALAGLGHQTSVAMRDVLGGAGLSPRRFMALQLLSDNGSMSQQAMVEALRVDPSVLVAVLNELEAGGFAGRRRHPHDRRRHIVEISPAGSDLFDRVRRAIADLERELVADLDPAEVSRLRTLLGRLRLPIAEAACAEDPTGG